MDEKQIKPESEQSSELPSDKIPNAHAAGNGALEKDDEMIDKISLDKEPENNPEGEEAY